VYSQAYQDTKSVTEILNKNYTSSQLLGVLDDLIFRALDPIIETTDFLDRLLAVLLISVTKTSKRKYAFIERTKLAELLVQYLITNDVKKKKNYIRRMRFERNIYFALINTFLQYGKEYHSLLIKDSKTLKATDELHKLQMRLSVHGDVWTAVQEVEVWHSQALSLRNQIVQKYMRHTVNIASGLIKKYGNYILEEDLLQNLLLGVTRGIEKCDPKRGTLTSCINLWIRDAASRGTHRKGYKENISISDMDESTIEKVEEVASNESVSDINMDSVLEVRQLAKYADPNGFARMELSIEEILSLDEQNQLRQYCK